MFAYRKKLISRVKHGKCVIKIFIPKPRAKSAVYYSFLVLTKTGRKGESVAKLLSWSKYGPSNFMDFL